MDENFVTRPKSVNVLGVLFIILSSVGLLSFVSFIVGFATRNSFTDIGVNYSIASIVSGFFNGIMSVLIFMFAIRFITFKPFARKALEVFSWISLFGGLLMSVYVVL